MVHTCLDRYLFIIQGFIHSIGNNTQLILIEYKLTHASLHKIHSTAEQPLKSILAYVLRRVVSETDMPPHLLAYILQYSKSQHGMFFTRSTIAFAVKIIAELEKFGNSVPLIDSRDMKKYSGAMLPTKPCRKLMPCIHNNILLLQYLSYLMVILTNTW